MTTPSAVSHRSTTTRRTPPEHHRAATEVLRNSGHPQQESVVPFDAKGLNCRRAHSWLNGYLVEEAPHSLNVRIDASWLADPPPRTTLSTMITVPTCDISRDQAKYSAVDGLSASMNTRSKGGRCWALSLGGTRVPARARPPRCPTGRRWRCSPLPLRRVEDLFRD